MQNFNFSGTNIWEYVILAAAMYLLNFTIYLLFNKGTTKGTTRRRATQLLKATLLATTPVFFAQIPVTSPAMLFNLAVCTLYGATFAIVSAIGNGKETPLYGRYIDILFGIYLAGWIIAVKVIVLTFVPAFIIVADIIIALLLFALLIMGAIQWGHYFMYKAPIDENGIQAAIETNRPEIKEFIKAMNPIATIAIVVALAAMLFACIAGESLSIGYAGNNTPALVAAVLYILLFTKKLWIGKKSYLMRSGLPQQYVDVMEYRRQIQKYKENVDKRVAGLQLKQLGTPCNEPHTYIMIIGESASREYMSAFTPMEHDTTPWLREMKEKSEQNIIFRNAYSCALQTVPTLERALTEKNLYNDKEFQEAISIVDIARKAGYTINWYSNQGYISRFDTSITLVARSSDTAKWVTKEFGCILHDEALLTFLDEVDPTKNNLLVVHLKGSHCNFLNRYPKEATVWGEPGVEDPIPNYMNSIRYTDGLMKKIYEYGCEKLNLQAMLYFSDHACIPDARRTPQFIGFGMVKIPLAIICTDDYVSRHKERYDALRANKDKYFTNDLVYELFCGLLDIKSDHFDTANSLAYKEYRYTREMLLTNGGKTPITDDKSN